MKKIKARADIEYYDTTIEGVMFEDGSYGIEFSQVQKLIPDIDGITNSDTGMPVSMFSLEQLSWIIIERVKESGCPRCTELLMWSLES